MELPGGDRAAETDARAAARAVSRAGSSSGMPQPDYAQPGLPAGVLRRRRPETASDLLTGSPRSRSRCASLRAAWTNWRTRLQRHDADLGKQIDDMKFQAQNPPAGSDCRRVTAAARSALRRARRRPDRRRVPRPRRAAGSHVQPAAGPRTPEVALQEGYAAMGRRDYDRGGARRPGSAQQADIPACLRRAIPAGAVAGRPAPMVARGDCV